MMTPRDNCSDDDIPFVTFTWSRDVHYAKALLGSISYFYPHRRIIVVAERDLPTHDIRQISRFPNTDVIPVMTLIEKHKLHLVGLLNKLNVLFLPDVPKAIVADADSVLVDFVTEKLDTQTVFTGLNGSPSIESDERGLRSFEEWSCTLADARRLAPGFRESPLRYVQGSHFFLNTERFPYHLLFSMLPELGYRHADPSALKCGDQGFWNLLINHPSLAPHDCAVVPSTVSSSRRWPNATKPEWNTTQWLTTRSVKEVSFVHYIGSGRRYRRRSHVCPTPLEWGTAMYYHVLGRKAFVADEARRAVQLFLRWVDKHLFA